MAKRVNRSVLRIRSGDEVDTVSGTEGSRPLIGFDPIAFAATVAGDLAAFGFGRVEVARRMFVRPVCQRGNKFDASANG